MVRCVCCFIEEEVCLPLYLWQEVSLDEMRLLGMGVVEGGLISFPLLPAHLLLLLFFFNLQDVPMEPSLKTTLWLHFL